MPVAMAAFAVIGAIVAFASGAWFMGLLNIATCIGLVWYILGKRRRP